MRPNQDAEAEEDITSDAPDGPDVTLVSGQGDEETPPAAPSTAPVTAANLLAAILASMGGLGERDTVTAGGSLPLHTGAAQPAQPAPPVAPVPVDVVAPGADDVVAPAPAQPITGVPPVSIPIPGFHSLGNGTAPPPVEHANFAPAGSTRWYCVTRGIRVGVFGGW